MSTLTQGKLENKKSYLRRRVGGWVLKYILFVCRDSTKP